MKKITDVYTACQVLKSLLVTMPAASWRWRANEQLFEFRYNRRLGGHVWSRDTFRDKFIDTANKAGYILGIADLHFEDFPGDKKGGAAIVVLKFTLEQKKAVKVSLAEQQADLPPRLGDPEYSDKDQPASQRQFIGVYVDSDEDAKKVLSLLGAVRDSLVPPMQSLSIPSLDWDSFEPSTPQDEAWRSDAFRRAERSGDFNKKEGTQK